MKHNPSLKAVALTLMLLNSVVAFSAPTAESYEGIKATVMPYIGDGKTILGQEFNYPTGAPRIQSYMVMISPNKGTDIHSHRIPVLVNVVSGQLEVDYGSKGKKVVKAGESYVEAINWCHKGTAVGRMPVKVQVTYLGQNGDDSAKPLGCEKLN